MRGGADRLREVARGFTVWETSMLGAYVAIRLLSTWGKHPGIFGDTPEYLHFRWFNTPRPWTPTILFGIFGNHHAGILVAQVLIACAAWTFLAHTIATIVRRHCGTVAQVIMVGTVLAIALSVPVAEWDYQLLSESLSISLLALFVALLVRFIDAPSARRAVAVAVCGAFWMQTRDSNTIIFVVVIAVIGLVGLFPSRRTAGSDRREWFGGLVALCAVAVLISFALSLNTNDQRLLKPPPVGAKYQRVTAGNLYMMDVLGKRLFHEPKAVKFFVHHGMPAEAAKRFVDFAGVDQDYKMYTDVPFVSWVNRHGLRTLTLWLASNPWDTVREPFRSSGDLFTPNLAAYFGNIRHTLPPVVDDLIWPEQPSLVVEALLISFGVAALVAWRRRRKGLLHTDGGLLLMTGVTLCVSALIALIVTWQLEWLEEARHNITNSIALRLAIVQLIVAALVLNATPDDPAEVEAPDPEVVSEQIRTTDGDDSTRTPASMP
jgi:hypothetical protein